MLRMFLGLGLAGVIGGAAALWLTQPATVDENAFAQVTADAARGEFVFWAAGCAS